MSKPQNEEVVIIDCSPTGEITILTQGFEGKACLDAVAELKAELGEVTSEQATAEMNKPQQQTQQAKSNVTRRNK